MPCPRSLCTTLLATALALVLSACSDGTDHTFLLYDLTQTAGGVSVTDWVGAFLTEEGWETTID